MNYQWWLSPCFSPTEELDLCLYPLALLSPACVSPLPPPSPVQEFTLLKIQKDVVSLSLRLVSLTNHKTKTS